MRNIDKGTGTLNSIRAKGYVLVEICSIARSCRVARALLLVVGLASAVPTLSAHGRKKHEDFGLGFSTEISAPESEVLQAV